ncbi:MAG: hypothetical protein AB1798_19270, partial [Spirochaetota bacterium]
MSNVMAETKSLFGQLLERFLDDKNRFWRFWLALAFVAFSASLGFILERSILAFLGYGLLPLSILLVVLIRGSLYLQDIYEIEDFDVTLNYLLSSLFDLGTVTLKISGGKKVLKAGKVNTLDKIGGPGTISIEPGNAVVLETLLMPTKILGAGEHKISRNEIIKDIIGLEEYYDKISEIVVSTQDGIDVKISNVEFRFRIDHVKHEEGLRSLKNPYPFSVQAVRKLAYDRTVGDKGITPWPEAVPGIVKGIISEHISNRTLDMLTSPNILELHPLDDLRRSFDLPQNREKSKGMGTNLLWVNIGDFSVVSEDVDKQLFGVWAAR